MAKEVTITFRMEKSMWDEIDIQRMKMSFTKTQILCFLLSKQLEFVRKYQSGSNNYNKPTDNGQQYDYSVNQERSEQQPTNALLKSMGYGKKK